MRGALRTTAVLLALLSGTFAQARDEHFLRTVNGKITIAADGTVKDVAIGNIGSSEQSLKTFVIEKIKAWEFYPVQVDGVPREATVPMTFDLIAAMDSDDKVKTLQFANLHLGKSAIEIEVNKRNGIEAGNRPGVAFPRPAMLDGVGAKVTVVMDLGPDGAVRNAAILDVGVLNTDKRSAKQYARSFEKASLMSVKNHRWPQRKIAELDCLKGCIVTFSVYFVPSSFNNTAWNAYVPMAVVPPAWYVTSELKDLDAPEQSQIVRLKNDPTGKPIEIGG